MKIIMRTIFVLILLSAVARFAVGAENTRDGRANEFAESPKIDGKLDEACWKGVEPLDKFVLVIYGKGPASAQTKVYVGHHDSILYVGVDCLEPHRERLAKLFDEKKINPLEESVELFIDSFGNGEMYYQFIAGINDERYDAKKLDGKWSGVWQSKASLTDTGYSIEFAVPFTTIDAKIRPGIAWKFNICRTRSGGDEKELSTWSDTKGGFHAPNRFGRLVFEDYADFFNTYIEKISAPILKRLDKLFEDYPISSAKYELSKEQTHKSVAMLKSKAKQDAESESEVTELFDECGKTLQNLEAMIAKIQLEVIRNEFQH